MRRSTTLPLLLLLGCDVSLELADGGPAASITRVSPSQVLPGGTLEITGRGLHAFEGRALTLALSGRFAEPGGEPEGHKVRLPVTYDNGHRVLANLLPEHVAALGARTLEFEGMVTLSAAGDDAPPPISLEGVELTLFPPNVQRVVAAYDVWRSEDAITDGVGIEVRREDPADYERALDGGVEVRGATGAAKRAGLRANDRIIEINGRQIGSYADFRMAALEAGDHAHLRVLRGGVLELSAPVGVVKGLDLAPPDAGPGLVVGAVKERSLAWRAGLQEGDRLVRAGRSVVGAGDADARKAALAGAFSAAGAGDLALVTWRGQVLAADVTVPWSARGVPPWLLAFAMLLLVCSVVLMGFMAPFAGIATYLERRIAGRMQSRIGPNRVGPQGLLQFVADGLKLIQKEDLIPEDADPILFRIAPYLVFLGVFLTFISLPFSSTLIPADLNIGILYILSVTSLVVVGILMSGWASNNKWSLLGGMRSAAQIVSYEIPAALAVLPVVLMTGSLSMQEIIKAQGGLPWEWNIFSQPALLICFFIFFIASLAEGNRTPFDLPEAESELVSGYNTEYSGMRFAFFFLGEFANIYVMSALTTTLFLGGWLLPTFETPAILGGIALSEATWRNLAPTLFSLMVAGAGAVIILFATAPSIWKGFNLQVAKFTRPALVGLGVLVIAVGAAVPAPQWLGMEALRLAVFQAKAIFLVLVIIWIRWTLPRLRVDQMMSLCWKYFVPFSFAAFLFTAVWVAFAPEALRWVTRLVLTGLGAATVVVFVGKVLRTFRATRSVLYANPFV
jgi:NADH-quinone oxidoreductase subunit H